MPQPTRDIAIEFGLGQLSTACIPGTRLSDILAKLHRGQAVSEPSLKYLRQQNLDDLYRFACGEISREAYFSQLNPEQIAQQKAAKAQQDANEESLVSARNKHQVEKQARKLKQVLSDQERHRRAREETEAVLAAQRARRATWAAQRERNREEAAALYRTRKSTTPSTADLLAHFHLKHLPKAQVTTLHDILVALYRGTPLTDDALTRLEREGLPHLFAYVSGHTTFASYLASARAVEVAEAARIARENDPAYIARQRNAHLCAKFKLTPTPERLSSHLITILEHIDAGQRLRDEDFAWLFTDAARLQVSTCLLQTCHLLEAVHQAERYQKSSNPWVALTACSHYRKGGKPENALTLLDSLGPSRVGNKKLHSAICTVRGGALRDLGQREDALSLGHQAHELQPDNFRPCTLLGALHMELGNFDAGHTWYMKAEKRGARQQSIDDELRKIFRQADKTRRDAMSAFLLGQNPTRYAWAKDSGKPQRATDRTRARSATRTD